MRFAPEGVLASAATPFDSSGAVDTGAVADLWELLIESSVQGLFVLGTAGETMLMSEKERKLTLDRGMGNLSTPAQVVVNVGTTDTAGSVRLAEHANDVGATAVAILAPYYFRYEASQLIRHFDAIASSVPDMAIYIYDNPDRVGYEVGPDTVKAITDRVENVVGLKDTGDSLARISTYISQLPDLQVYAGNNALVHPCLDLGGRGAVSALATAVPELVGSIYTAWTDGRYDDSRGLQLSLTRLLYCFRGVPYLGGIKWLARHRGFPAGAVRAPQADLSDSEGRELMLRVSRYAELERWVRPRS